jgi:predicted protein tyrosine phosphatase
MKISALSKLKFDKYLTDCGISKNNVGLFKDKYFISISHSTVFDIDESEKAEKEKLEADIRTWADKKMYHINRQEYELASRARDIEKKMIEQSETFNDEWMPMFRENSENVLVLLFDDVIDENFNTMNAKSFTDEQAKEILDFLYKIKPTNSTELVIHCAMGSSRSVAVAEFAAEMFGETHINARIDRKANPLVLKKLHEAIKINKN